MGCDNFEHSAAEHRYVERLRMAPCAELRWLRTQWGWDALLDPVSSTVERFDFSKCALNVEKAKCIGERLSRYEAMREVSFRLNPSLSTDGLAALRDLLSN